MAGVDTVKLVAEIPRGARLHLRPELEADPKASGRKGSLWYQGYRVPSIGSRITVKGVGAAQGYAIFEGSLPKALGLHGVADPEDVETWRGVLDEGTGGLFPRDRAYLGRCDCTQDEEDPEGLLRAAAIGWRPHERSRYVEAVYNGGETVFLYNKSRGVRVYDKWRESGIPSFMGITRVEYQLRSDWCRKLGLREFRSPYFADNVAAAVAPLVEGLRSWSEIAHSDVNAVL